MLWPSGPCSPTHLHSRRVATPSRHRPTRRPAIYSCRSSVKASWRAWVSRSLVSSRIPSADNLQRCRGMRQPARSRRRPPTRLPRSTLWRASRSHSSARSCRRSSIALVLSLSGSCRRDYLPRWNGISMLYEAEWTRGDHLELATDACDTGFGGHWGRRWFSGTWDRRTWGEAMRERRTRSMPFCELYALLVAAALWGDQWSGKKVTFLCDCQPIVQAAEKGSSSSLSVMHLLRQLCEIACRCGFDFRVEHIRRSR